MLTVEKATPKLAVSLNSKDLVVLQSTIDLHKHYVTKAMDSGVADFFSSASSSIEFTKWEAANEDIISKKPKQINQKSNPAKHKNFVTLRDKKSVISKTSVWTCNYFNSLRWPWPTYILLNFEKNIVSGVRFIYSENNKPCSQSLQTNSSEEQVASYCQTTQIKRIVSLDAKYSK